MKDKKQESRNETFSARLHGWDDEKVYFWSPETGGQCVSDEPELLRKLIAICAEYFQDPSDPGRK
jgi:hypothetical protein